MSINIGDNFSYLGKKFLDNRESFNTLEEMDKCTDVPVGFITYCIEDKKRYEYTEEGWIEYTVGSTDHVSHSHNNKEVLDNITEDNISSWNNKSEFNGDYNSLTNKPNIPSIEGLATEDYVDNAIENIDIPTPPTKTSELENDSNFITNIPSEYITETELDNKGYLTEHIDISGKADKTELHSHNNKEVLDNITEDNISSWNNKSEFNGDYNSLTNKPNIPSIEGLATEDYVDNAIENIDIPTVDLSDYALKEEMPTKISELDNDTSFVNEAFVSNKIIETTNSLETIVSSEIEPTDENVSIWVNTSEETIVNPLARINDDIISSESTWSSEKINSLKLVKEGNIIKLMLGDIELSTISIE